jgi:hypothetical protein
MSLHTTGLQWMAASRAPLTFEPTSPWIPPSILVPGSRGHVLTDPEVDALMNDTRWMRMHMHWRSYGADLWSQPFWSDFILNVPGGTSVVVLQTAYDPRMESTHWVRIKAVVNGRQVTGWTDNDLIAPGPSPIPVITASQAIHPAMNQPGAVSVRQLVHQQPGAVQFSQAQSHNPVHLAMFEAPPHISGVGALPGSVPFTLQEPGTPGLGDWGLGWQQPGAGHSVALHTLPWGSRATHYNPSTAQHPLSQSPAFLAAFSPPTVQSPTTGPHGTVVRNSPAYAMRMDPQPGAPPSPEAPGGGYGPAYVVPTGQSFTAGQVVPIGRSLMARSPSGQTQQYTVTETYWILSNDLAMPLQARTKRPF